MLSIVDRFEKHALSRPDAIAIRFENTPITYKELNARANQLARYLRETLDLKLETPIPILLTRNVNLIISILAILKAGGAYVPLDPFHPPKRLAAIVNSVGSKFCITEQEHSELLPDDIQRIFFTENSYEHYATTNLMLPIAANQLTYILFTSGSTGAPKGVLIEQESLINVIDSIGQEINYKPTQVVLILTAATFDIFGLELFLPLLNGGLGLLASAHAQTDLAELTQLLTKVDVVQATPSLWQWILQNHLQIPAHLQILCGGEALSLSLAKRLLSHVPYFWNVYGPTETTIWSLIARIDPNTKDIHLGKPLANTTICIINDELLIGGKGLARGYLKQKNLTEDKFIITTQRFYKTGDRVKQLDDGTLIFLGRLDDQIKLHGYRIEIGEILSALAQLPEVLHCHILLQNMKITAYIVLNPSRTQLKLPKLSDAQLHNHLSTLLPHYMLPHVYCFVDQLPLTSHGKIDQAKLKAISKQTRTKHEMFIYPQTNVEMTLRAMWASLFSLSAETISLNDHFFQLGGDSLKAAQLIWQIQQQFNVRLTLQALFRHPNITVLANWISKQHPHVPAPQHIVSSNYYLATPSEERLWFIEQLNKGPSVYHLTTAVRLQGNLNIKALQYALKTVYERHDVLRSHYAYRDAKLWRIVRNDTLSLDLLYCTDVDALVRAEVKKPFDLAKGPLIRATLAQLSENDYVLLLCLHHLITDDWSDALLQREIMQLYAGKKLPPAQSLGNNLPPIDTKSLTYWQHQLKNASRLTLPLDQIKTAANFAGQSHPVQLPKALSFQLLAFSRQHCVTLYTTLLAGFMLLLHRLSNQNDVIIGTPTSGRTSANTQYVFGCLINLVAIRHDFSNPQNFIELVKSLQKTVLSAYDAQHVPFEQVVKALGLERDLAHHPLFQVLFVWQNTPKDIWQFPEVNATTLQVDPHTAQFDFSLILQFNQGIISGQIEFNTDLLHLHTVQRWWEQLTLLLTHALQTREPIQFIDYLTPNEKQLLKQWEYRHKKFKGPNTLVQHFAATVKRFPLNIALTFGDEKMTYQELDEKSNQLAHWLADTHALTVDTLVPVFFNKSPDLIIAILAILKAGGAYVPIDTQFPIERIAHILTDTKATLVLTNAMLARNIDGIFSEIIGTLDQAKGYRAAPLEINSQESDLAYVIYTSGSTGKPKGVMIEHASIVNTVLTQIPAFRITPNSKILQMASISFDSAVCELFRALLSGACLALNPSESLLPGENLAKVLIDQAITVVTLPPAALALLPRRNYPHLATLITAGEACPVELMQYWSSHYFCVNAYGPTEAAVCATLGFAHEVGGLPVIGKPLANVAVKVLDQYQQLSSLQTTGELYIGGIGLARGYLNLPELTRERFVILQGKRWYKTGDCVRWLPDGNLDFLGRNDDQVKIRGFRVELAEVEAQLKLYPGILQVAVLALGKDSERYLVAYCSAVDAQLSSLTLKKFLENKLPSFMQPKYIVILETLPLTTNRKIDKKALASHSIPELPSKTYHPPRNALEYQLVLIWEELLNTRPIGINDNFFHLGGHSLLLATFNQRIAAITNQHYSLALFYSKPTIAELAALLETRQDVSSCLVPLKLTDSKKMLFLMPETTGTPYPYLPLSHHLTAQLTLYGLQDSLEPAFTDLSAVAAHYIKAIQEIEPHGPYYLGGWCLGGVIAYEMAQQLSSQGFQVEKLILIDSSIDLDKWRKQTDDATTFNNIMATTTHLNPSARKTYAAAILKRMLWLRTYRAKPYAASTLLIKAQELSAPDDKITPSAANGWEDYIHHLQIEFAPGNHHSVLKVPFVRSLARIINEYLA